MIQFIKGQNKEPAAVVKLDHTICGDKITGDIAVLELRLAGQTWQEPTPDRENENWIELPNQAGGIMGSKFNDVSYEYENNPFDFNDCGYTDRNLFDIGVEVTDLPIKYMEFNQDGTYQTKIIER